MDQAGAADGLLEGGPDGRVELGEGAVEGLGRDPDLGDLHTVEALRVVDQGRGAAMMHVVADGPHLLQGGLDVELGTGQQVAVDAIFQGGVAAQIDSGDHTANCLRPVPPHGSPYHSVIHGQRVDLWRSGHRQSAPHGWCPAGHRGNGARTGQYG
ncbi:hypothetical protein GCM10020000_60220 [Streptomyces olivoverticillatus]